MSTMPSPAIDVSAGFLAGVIRRVRLWVAERVFVVGPAVWYGLVIASAAFAAVVGVVAGSLWLAAALGACAVLAVAPARVWHRLRRGSTLPVIFLARFGDESNAHAEIAQVHLDQLARRLRRSTVLENRLELRLIRSPVSVSEARRILRHTSGRAVISGTGLVVFDSARWDGWVVLRWNQLNSFTGRAGARFVDLGLRFIRTLPSLARLGTDAHVPISLLTADAFPADHATGIEATVFMLTGTDIPPTAVGSLVPAMPVEVRAVWENSRAMEAIQGGGSLLAAATGLEAAGDDHADHILLWNHCATLLLMAEQREGISSDDRLRVASKGVRVAPDDGVANSNVGICLVGRGDTVSGIAHLERALSSPSLITGHRQVGELLAGAYRQLGDVDGEVSALSRAWARSRLGRWRARRKIRRWALAAQEEEGT